jgi:hypothetical protein
MQTPESERLPLDEVTLKILEGQRLLKERQGEAARPFLFYGKGALLECEAELGLAKVPPTQVT